MEEAVHPLLDNPVPNSIEIKENGIIVDYDEKDGIVTAFFKDGRINKTTLSGVNIWLIPPLNGSIFYKTFEINALKWFLEEGGILIISS